MVKIKNSEAKQILIDFGVMPESYFFDARLFNFKADYQDNDITIFEFDFQKDHYAIVFDSYGDDDLEGVKSHLDWSDESEILPNPMSNGTFGYPFEQKVLFLLKKRPQKIRLDQVISNNFPDMSRSRIQKLIKQSQFSINGGIISTPNKLVDRDSEIKLIATINKKERVNLPVIYEDDNFLVINKPSGILTHAKNIDDLEYTVSDFVKDYLNINSDDLRFGIAHRLDRMTSGVIACAKNKEALDFLKKQFKDRSIKKIYAAVTYGHLKNQKAIINLPLARSIKNPSEFRVDPNGKYAETYYEILQSKDNYNLVELRPKTGRTHQLRVHLAYLNSPILGDTLYDGKKAKRLMLHAMSLEFTNMSDERIKVETKIPDEFFKWTTN